jgi:hypothetical protein
MTWDTGEAKVGHVICAINGERLDAYRPESAALAEAGEQGWELVSVVSIGGSKTGGRHEVTLYFKRPLAEDGPDERAARVLGPSAARRHADGRGAGEDAAD